MLEPIWDGVYPSFREAPAAGPGFSSGRWTERSLERLRGQAEPALSSTLLHPLAALALAEKGSLRVLDFGGGLGLTYAALLKAAGDPQGLEYHVVENSEVCAAGRAAFARDPRVRFHESLPALEGVDLAHAQSSLQYVEDWKGLLARLCAYGAPRLVLTDVPAGRFPTYASLQAYYGSRIPCWFFGLDELEGELARAGYRVLLRTRFLGPYLGVYQDYPMDNFPPERRIGASWNLLLARSA